MALNTHSDRGSAAAAALSAATAGINPVLSSMYDTETDA
jgi:hypothetical protein